MATRSPFLRIMSMPRAFSSGMTCARTRLMPTWRPTASAAARESPVIMTRDKTVSLSASTRFARLGPRPVGHCDAPGQHAVHRHRQYRLPFPGPLRRLARSDLDAAPFHFGRHSTPGVGLKLRCFGQFNSGRARHDGLAVRVLAGPLGRRRQAQQFGFQPARRRPQVVTTGRPSVSVPGLVEHHGGDPPAASSASPPLNRIPSCAPRPVATITRRRGGQTARTGRR